jgi:hypothetical protein
VAGGYHERDLWTDAGWDWRSRRDTVEQFVLNWIRKRDTLREHPERIVRLLREQLASPVQAAALVRFMELDDDDLARYARENFRRPIEEPRFWWSRATTSGLHPVIGISWHEANAFCAWKSHELGESVRLPSEDEVGGGLRVAARPGAARRADRVDVRLLSPRRPRSASRQRRILAPGEMVRPSGLPRSGRREHPHG